MAGTTKQNTTAKVEMEKVRLPRKKGKNAVQQEFFSVNGRNYLVECGKTVEVPAEVAEVIRRSEEAEDYAMQYAEEQGLREPSAN